MRVVVTGGHGFIGSHVLVQLVNAGHEVACLDVREPSAVTEPVGEGYRFVRGDVTDAADVFDVVARFEPDRVIHLASLLGRESQRDPRRAFAVNVDGTLNVLEAADTHGVQRVVAASSSSSYGPSTGDRLTEATPQTPRASTGSRSTPSSGSVGPTGTSGVSGSRRSNPCTGWARTASAGTSRTPTS